MGFHEEALWLAFRRFKSRSAKSTLMKANRPLCVAIYTSIRGYLTTRIPQLQNVMLTPTFYLFKDPTEQAVGIQLMLADCCWMKVHNMIGLVAIDSG